MRPRLAPSSVVIVHPSRLFSEALGNVLNNTRFKLVSVAADVDCVPFDVLDHTTLFVVGGRTPEHVANLVWNIKQRLGSAIIAVIGDPNEPETVAMALEAGAKGYLLESMTPRTMFMALELLLHEETALPPAPSKFLPPPLAQASEVTRDKTKAKNWDGLPLQSQEGIDLREPQLSARQAAILQTLIDGTPNKVIAQNLHISEATVKLHVKAVLRKIHVKNRTQAAVWALKNHYAGPRNSDS
jgi:two-component system, NarL family, nitrate/nitrite response regulator NarL